MPLITKALAKEKGNLATPNPKLSGRTLTQRAVEQVKEWYRSDKVSCVMPGMKHFVSVKTERRELKYRSALFSVTSERHTNHSKQSIQRYELDFLRLQISIQRNVFLQSLVAHMQSVCNVPQNVKLMWIGAKLCHMTLEDIPLKSHKHSLAQMTCHPSLPECHKGE